MRNFRDDASITSDYPPPPPYTPLPRTPPKYDERTPLLRQPRDHSPPKYQSSSENEKNLQIPWGSILKKFICLSIFITLTYSLIKHFQTIPEPPVKIAIIGAGPAGIGVAWGIINDGNIYAGVRRGGQTSNRKVEITIFEKKKRVGGRLALDFDWNYTAASGLGMQDLTAGALLSSRSILRDRVESEFGEKWKGRGDVGVKPREVGVFDGGVKVRYSRPIERMGWKSWVGFVLRYGPSAWKYKGVIKGIQWELGQFLRLSNVYVGIAEMVQASGLGRFVAQPGGDSVRDSGTGGGYVDEILEPQFMRELGQEMSELSALAVGMVLQREGWVDGAQGKVETALEMLLEKSGAKVRFGTEVLDFKHNDDTGIDLGLTKRHWVVETIKDDILPDLETFDHLVFAAPLSPRLLHELGVTNNAPSYRGVWVTILLANGKLDERVFGWPPDEILPIPGSGSYGGKEEWWNGLFEISHVKDIFGPDPNIAKVESVQSESHSEAVGTKTLYGLYRILSHDPITVSTLDILFGDSSTKVKELHEQYIEQGWPLLWPRNMEEIQGLGSFEIKKGNTDVSEGEEKGKGGGVWWTASYEGVMSSFEQAWVVGVNVGRLVAARVRSDGLHKG